MAAAAKKTRGRQKIAMQRIENDDDRMVTFSKRRSGLYKKANELATLCGAHVALLIFSQAGRAYSFGSPSIEPLAQRFLNRTGPALPRFEEARRRAKIDELCQRHNEVVEQVDALKARQEDLRKVMTWRKAGLDWWEIPVGEMNRDQLRASEFLFGEVAAALDAKVKENNNNNNFGSSSAAGSGANLGGAGGSI
ncbi:unnamed protein product [Linum tenue]|uniref:MADS-box domain-containing protein n=1 Tax=Linum tenue TaxID=586396 RepID=A0AAV0PV67_9ROSI|nr:unnamed protein product [Linum tenue]